MMGMTSMMGGFTVLFFIAFFAILITFVVNAAKGIGQWNQNNHSPQLTVSAKVVAKRINVSHTQHANAGDISGAHGTHSTSHTTYYATFEVQSGDRMEFQMDGSEYGMLVEGDEGSLTFQGTRYQGFVRRS